MTHLVTVTISAQLSDKVVANILSTAIEGGCDYWADIKAVRNPVSKADPDNFDLPHYLSARFLDREDRDSGGTVDLAGVAIGIARILETNFKADPDLKCVCLQLLADPENADYDAGDADCIIQAALFNEIVYG